MPLKPKELERLLVRKFGFTEIPHEPSHTWFELQLEGVRPVRTKVSHHCDEIGAPLLSAIARQVGVRPDFFRQMVGCQRSRDDYYRLLRSDPSRRPR